MNKFAIVSLGAYCGTTTMTKRQHLSVSQGIFDPTPYPAGVSITGGGSISIMGSMHHSIIGG